MQEQAQERERQVQDLSERLGKEREKRAYFEQQWELLQKKLNGIVRMYEQTLSRSGNSERLEEVTRELQQRSEELMLREQGLRGAEVRLKEAQEQIAELRQTIAKQQIRLQAQSKSAVSLPRAEPPGAAHFETGGKQARSVSNSSNKGHLNTQSSETREDSGFPFPQDLGENIVSLSTDRGHLQTILDRLKRVGKGAADDEQTHAIRQQVARIVEYFGEAIESIQQKIRRFQQGFERQNQYYLQSIQQHKDKTVHYRQNFALLKQKLRSLAEKHTLVLEKFEKEILYLQQIHFQEIETMREKLQRQGEAQELQLRKDQQMLLLKGSLYSRDDSAGRYRPPPPHHAPTELSVHSYANPMRDPYAAGNYASTSRTYRSISHNNLANSVSRYSMQKHNSGYFARNQSPHYNN